MCVWLSGEVVAKGEMVDGEGSMGEDSGCTGGTVSKTLLVTAGVLL